MGGGTVGADCTSTCAKTRGLVVGAVSCCEVDACAIIAGCIDI